MSRETRNRPSQLTIEVSDEMQNELDEIKKRTGATKSQFARDAVWEKIAATRASHPAFQNQLTDSQAKMPNQ